MQRDGRFEAFIFAGLVLSNLAIAWALPVIPAQDAPQHLAITRIFLDHARPDLPFGEFYHLPERFQTYFSTYYLLAFLGRFLGVHGAFRFATSLYLVGFMLAFRALAAAIRRAPQADATRVGVLGALLVWNPVFLMGFFAYALALPPLLFAAAALVRLGESARIRIELVGLAAATALASVLHHVAAGTVVLLAIVNALVAPSRRRSLGLVTVLVSASAVVASASALGESGLGASTKIDVREALRGAEGFEALSALFRFTWTSLPARLDDVLWTVAGPYRFRAILLRLLVFGAFVLFVSRDRPAEVSAPISTSSRRLVIWFGLACWMSPFGAYLGDEIAFLDLRLLTVAATLLFACADPAWFRARRAFVALALVCAGSTAHFASCALGFSRDARAALDLLKRAEPGRTLLGLDYHGESRYFGRRFNVTHFLSMYYTVDHGGISTQFWARYTPHLPIDYRPGKRPAQPPDWSPWDFSRAHLADVDYVLVQWATEADTIDIRRASTVARELLDAETTRIGCEGLWCLYRTGRRQ